MQLRQAMIFRINSLLEEHNLTEYSLSLKAGIPTSTLNDFLRGKVTLLKIDNLLHICEGFNLQLKDFFNDPVFEDVEFDRDNLNDKKC